MKYLFFPLLICSLCVSSCDNQGTRNETVQTESKAPTSKLNEAGTNALVKLLNDYYLLKDAFVATDEQKVNDAAASLVSDVNSLNNADSSASSVTKPYTDTVLHYSNEIHAIKDDKKCEKKRIPFEKLSDAMFLLLKSTELKNAVVYRQFCPMAFNDKGAYWLSSISEIRNPYFGKKMLECGEITDTLR
jgi:hypothetical protein